MDSNEQKRVEQGKRLAAARFAAGYRSARAAAVDNEWPESTYRAHEAGTRTIGQDDAERYARRFQAAGADVNASQILFGLVMPTGGGYRMMPKSVGEQELPVYASVEAGPGEMVFSTDRTIDVVPRPWFMGTVTDGYAVLVVGESMVPAFEPGDYAIINPSLPVKRDRDVILTGGEEEGEFHATIKRLVNWTPDEWILRQFNPPDGEPRDFRRPRRDWPKAVRVVGRWIGS